MKIQNSSNDRLNFGWGYKTHERITQLALRQVPELKNLTDVILLHVKLPDLVERGFMGNKHCYFPPDEWAGKQSFGLFTQKNNAFYVYKKHCAELLDGHLSAIGDALHYFQDVTLSMHTKEGTLGQKLFDFTHMNFEFGALARQDILAQNYKPKTIDSSISFDDLFMQNVEFSRNPKLQVTKNNKTDWFAIQQECFDRAVDSSAAFLKKLKDANLIII